MVTKEELDDMAEKAINTFEDLTEDRLFLGLLHARRIDNLSLLFRYSGDETQTEDYDWWRFAIYFELAMTLSAELGNLWFFRLQIEVDWQDKSFPFKDMEPPRWMVTEWRDSDEQRAEGDAQDPAAWASIDVPPVYPGVEEHLFIQRAGLAIERKHQLAYISKLRRAYRDKAEATFHQNPDHPRYFLVKIRTQHPRAPPPNTPIQISLWDYTFFGKAMNTVQDILGDQPSGFEFMASITADSADLNFGRRTYEIDLRFPGHERIFEKRVSSLSDVRKMAARNEGVFVPQLLFGVDAPNGKDTELFNQRMAGVFQEAEQRFHEGLDRLDLSEAQKAFALDCVAPKSSSALAYGSSGSGKTRTLAALLHALVREGMKVLVCGPTTESVEAILQSYREARNPASPGGGSYALWTD